MANLPMASAAYPMPRARSVASEGPAEPRGLFGYAELPPHPRWDVGILTGTEARRVASSGARSRARQRAARVSEGGAAMVDDIGKMRFRRMDEGTDADFAVLARVHQEAIRKLPDQLMGILTELKADEAYPVDRLQHSLQAATRALRDGRDEEYVVCALLHDIGESLGPFNHGEVAATVLKPFVSEANHRMLEHHPVFQVYFYGQHLGIDPNERERYRGQPHFDRTAEFCALYDEVSFDSAYRSEPMAAFEPMVRRVFDKRWTPPS